MFHVIIFELARILQRKERELIKKRGAKMKSRIKMKLNVVTFVIILSVFFLHTAVSAKIVANFSSASFQGPESGTMEDYVVAGAGYFLTAYSDYLQALNRIELAEVNGLDYTDLQKLIDRSLLNIDNAVTEYDGLTQLADATAYDLAVRESLATYNYTATRVEKQVNNCIFDNVEAYLKAGDVRGLYKNLHESFKDLSTRLNEIKVEADAGVHPDLSKLWRLNQEFLNAYLLGQYTAEVFSQITGN